MTNNTVQHLPQDTKGSVETKPIHVLCVDDETSFLDSTKQILELQSAFLVETASSVNEALQKMKHVEFDVVVSDYMMPETSFQLSQTTLTLQDNNCPKTMKP